MLQMKQQRKQCTFCQALSYLPCIKAELAARIHSTGIDYQPD